MRPMQRCGDRQAFTLIELLIVIAIIAILALIAVPNFLEAQVRAKVSRVHADMRSIATAVEAYSVDWGRPPLGKNAVWVDTCVGGTDYRSVFVNGRQANWACMAFMTTPVAYISSIQRDPFVEKGAVNMDYREIYQYQTWLCPDVPKGPECYALGYTWLLNSPGPSRDGSGSAHQILRRTQQTVVYDSSNGTISYGFIIRTNKGVFGASDR